MLSIRWVLLAALFFIKSAVTSATCVNGTYSIYDSFPEIKSLITADIDGDGDNDLIATSPTLNSLFWFENQDGTFEYNLIATVTSPYSVCTGDFDNDGDADIAVTIGYLPVFVWWYQNVNGDGSAWTQRYGYQMTLPFYKIACADIDNDGDDDVVPYDYFGSEVFYISNINGDGSSFTVTQIADAENVSSVAFADFNNDGDYEFLVQSYMYGLSLYDYVNNEWEATQLISSSTYDGVADVKVADLNNDGNMDFIVAAHLSKSLVWYENTGAGASFIRHTIENGRPFAVIYTDDMNNDGDIDVISATNGAIMVYENDGTGLNWTPTRIVSASQSLIVADLDGDNYSDIATLGFYTLSWIKLDDGVCASEAMIDE